MSINIVLTGGPSSGKTHLCHELKEIYASHLFVCEEAAGMLFRGGFPRDNSSQGLQNRQYAIFHLQKSLENIARNRANKPKYILYDRGLLDGLCYWPSDIPSFFASLKTSKENLYKRYDIVIQVGVPSPEHYKMHSLRTEDQKTSLIMEERLKEIWSSHPNYKFIAYDPQWKIKRDNVVKHIQKKASEHKC